MRMGCRCIAIPGRFNSFENQVGHTRHGGNYHYDPVMFCRFADDGGTLAERAGIPHGGTAQLHYDQTFSLQPSFSNFCKTAPSLCTSGTSSRFTPAPSMSDVVKLAS